MPGATKVEKLLKATKDLSDEERTELAHRLLDTVEAPDPQADLDDQAWVAEIERRAESAISGKTRGVPWSKVKASLEQKLKKAAKKTPKR